MRTIVVTSTKPYTGKSGLCIALIGHFAARGLDVGYFKPYGSMPVVDGDVTTDEDALLKALAHLQKSEEQYNEQCGIMSICIFTAEP